tara:strand:- start:330 stop:1418 length:1089 start_codon:yes stop_codon:yes gene_type:complete
VIDKYLFINQGKIFSKIKLDNGQVLIADTLNKLKNKIELPRGLFTNFFFRVVNMKGIYIYGGVGRGKSMLMDNFFQSLVFNHKKRMHFHDFMKTMHRQIFEIGKLKKDLDPIELVTKNFIKETKVLCFDEMEIKDIADAMILFRLFKSLFDKGLILVTTSNQEPKNLYLNGLHRDRFLPFIKLIEKKLKIVQINDGKDWRKNFLIGKKTWLHPNNEATSKKLNYLFDDLTRGFKLQKENLLISGRAISMNSSGGGVAFFDFKDLCENPLGSSDFLEIADRFKVLFISNIPILDQTKNNEARRFIWLIDALYDRKRFLVASAEVEVKQLYQGYQWRFEFKRIKSRLFEMSMLKKSESIKGKIF